MSVGELVAAVDDFLASSAAGPGCVAYRIDGAGHHEVYAAGVADPSTGGVMTADATFRIASCTKTFTAATALRLAEMGHVSIDDPVAGVFPVEMAGRLELGDITLAQLLQHTSGLPDMDGEAFMDELCDNPTKVWTPWEKIERSIVGRPRTGAPGPPARYSDVGYIVAAMAIEAITGEPLHDTFRRINWCRRRLPDPLHGGSSAATANPGSWRPLRICASRSQPVHLPRRGSSACEPLQRFSRNPSWRSPCPVAGSARPSPPSSASPP